MKAFIVAALLVACVAGQLDTMEWNKYKPTYHRGLSTLEDLLVKEKLGRHMMDYNTKNIFDSSDITSVFGGRRGDVIPLEELVTLPLFREYMEIPLFSQFWEEHPVVFRKYVESPLFQQFMTMPQFVMYFRNPVLFYKYIYPQLQVISQVVYPTSSSTEGIFDYGTTSTSRYTPYAYKFQPKWNRGNEWSVPLNTYNKWNMNMNTYPYTPTTTTTQYKYLLEKMMNNLNMNKVGGLTETLTDVNMLPTGQIKEQTFGKIVNPITGLEKITVGDVKVVDEKIIPVRHNSMDFPYEMETSKYPTVFGHHTKTIKDILLKHIILNKVFGDKKVLTPEVIEVLFGEHKNILPMMFHKKMMTPEMLEVIFGNKKVLSPEVYESLFDTKKTMTPEIFEIMFGEHKNTLRPEIYEMLIKGNKHVMTPEVLETIFGKKIYTPEVYSTLFGDNMNMNMYNNEDMYNVNYEPYTTTYKNKMMVSPFVNRMLKNHRFSPKMDVTMTKMVEEMKMEKLMKELIKNKEHTKIWNMDSEITKPWMMENEPTKYHHIPLTLTKPMVGSMIDEFTKEKEIKF